ncbi:hypothetical protein A6A40_05760 [Azospirillum humicireducens]|uniref:Uncharacterized protein n=1 Tax=Azospirillum humicireducens TaxID=1226968 RepID=A0A161JH24_9PROT|nr:hypothetical protein [Azospirillum humicireducens]ANC91447.1 hypothetical protein A6A40_05760 [Azospirillum humicireducens]
MAYDHRSNDPRDLDAQDLAEMTRNFLAKGGSIVQCPPGASENVVYRKGGFRRRTPNDTKAAADKSADTNSTEAGAKDAGPAAPEAKTGSGAG